MWTLSDYELILYGHLTGMSTSRVRSLAVRGANSTLPVHLAAAGVA